MNQINYGDNSQGYMDYSEHNKENINYYNMVQSMQPGISLNHQKREFGVEVGSNGNNMGNIQVNSNVGVNNNPKYFEKINKKFIETNLEVNTFLRQTGTSSTSTQSSSVTNSNQILALKTPLYHRYAHRIPHEYLIDIWENLKSEELFSDINFGNIQKQTDINEKMRAILVDWLVDVHSKFNLSTETLFLTVNIIDRFLSTKQVLRTKLQLIGVAALLIACKYEEIYVPDLRDFVYVTDKTYKKEEILASEKELLFTLGFSVTTPTSFRFFEIISLNFNFNELEFTYGKYLLEYYLIDSKMNKYPPSLISLSVAYIIMKMNNYPNYQEIYNLINKTAGNWGAYWTSNLSNSNTFSFNSRILKECAKEIYYLVENAEVLNFKAVHKKFSLQENHMVSLHGMDGITKVAEQYNQQYNNVTTNTQGTQINTNNNNNPQSMQNKENNHSFHQNTVNPQYITSSQPNAYFSYNSNYY